MPRRNRKAPRPRRPKPVVEESVRSPSPDQLAGDLVQRGLASKSILGSFRRSPEDVSVARERRPGDEVAAVAGTEGRERGPDSFPAQTGLRATDYPHTTNGRNHR